MPDRAASSRTPKSRLRRISRNLTPIFGMESFPVECHVEIKLSPKVQVRPLIRGEYTEQLPREQLQSTRRYTIVTTFLAPQAN